MKGFRRVVFVHVPKTAGTSLRHTLAENFGESGGELILDYGLGAPETSGLVRRHLAAGDRAGLCEALAARERFVLFGHLRAADYRALLPVADFVTVLRDPFERIVSEYNHFVTHYRYARSFREFIDGVPFRNRQSLFAGGIPLEAYSFVGLHERGPADLAGLAARMGVGAAVPRVNVGDYARVDRAGLRAEHGAYFRAVNARDYALVAAARARRAAEG